MTKNTNIESKTPAEIKAFLDLHVVAHDNAKRALAIALRNRHRMLQIKDEDLKNNIRTNNVLLIGKTGIGKTELVKRLAELESAPFIRSDATKFTEVGYVGKDVESLVHDLVEKAVTMEKNLLLKHSDESTHEAEAKLTVIKAILKKQGMEESSSNIEEYKSKLSNKELDDIVVEIEISQEEEHQHQAHFDPQSANSGYTTIGIIPFNDIFKAFSGEKRKIKRLKTQEAISEVVKNLAVRKANDKSIISQALKNAQSKGIIFIDEFDKLISSKNNFNRGDVSREGVQRDLLSIMDGSIVNTKHGSIDTGHILFIASGAFYHAKYSDLLPELQGRFPIKVSMKNLEVEDFIKIMTVPKYSILKQLTSLLDVEGIKLDFTEDGIQEVANIAYKMNTILDDIGARRLNNVLDKILEEISFNPKDYKNVEINKEYVTKTTEEEIRKIENKKDSYIL